MNLKIKDINNILIESINNIRNKVVSTLKKVNSYRRLRHDEDNKRSNFYFFLNL